jgi:hypothetical protein
MGFQNQQRGLITRMGFTDMIGSATDLAQFSTVVEVSVAVCMLWSWTSRCLQDEVSRLIGSWKGQNAGSCLSRESQRYTKATS